MAEGDGALYNNFKEQVMEGEFDLASGADTIKVILVSGHSTDIDSHTQYTDVSGDEYGAGSGYTVGGETALQPGYHPGQLQRSGQIRRR